MEWERRCLRLCAAMLMLAVVLRLGSLDAFLPMGQALEDPKLASFLVYLQTGRSVRYRPAEPTAQADPTIPTAGSGPLCFHRGDAGSVELTNQSPCQPDLEALAIRPLEWDLAGGEPKVLIVHTHTTESYTQTPSDTYEESSPYRTLEPGSNMLRVGDEVERLLQEAGIGVIHDEQFHDYPSYNGSYEHAASSVEALLAEYPSIELVLDLHRDAADTPYGQMVTRCTLNGKDAAQLMLVVGTASGYSLRPDWEENLSLALKLQILLQQAHPGICRDVNLVSQRYNQHLGPRALLIEVGAAGNTLDEALAAARALAQAIIQLSYGASFPD